MGELEDKLNAVLSDPGELERLTKMAGRLLGGGSAEAPEAETPPAEPLPAGLTAALGEIFSRRKGAAEPLLQAVGPYLDEPRRSRLQRALRVASTARAASAVWRRMGGFDGL